MSLDNNDPTEPLIFSSNHSEWQQQDGQLPQQQQQQQQGRRRPLVSTTEQQLLQRHHDNEQGSPLVTAWRRRAQELASSKAKHYAVVGLVSLDVACILSIIFITLVACDRGKETEEWVVRAKETLEVAGLVFSCLFLLELLWTVWAFGLRYLADWFHVFDAAVITTSFFIDVLTKGIIEEIGSLVIIFRLWRLVKVVEEISAGCAEQMEDIEARVEELGSENADLKRQIEALRNERWETSST